MIVRTAVLMSGLLASPALAEDRSATLLDLLSRVPTEAIESEPGDWSQLVFADVASAARALDPAPAGVDLAVLGPYARVWGTFQLGGAAASGMAGAWEPLIGFGPLDVEVALGFTTSGPSDSGLLIRLAPGAADRVGSALLANGYAEATQDGVTAWARGAEDYALDRAHYDMANPFGGDMGHSSRVALDGDLLMQAAGWPLLSDLLGAEIPKGHPDLPALAAALDGPDWGEARLLQAVVLPHQIDLATGRGGMPPWRVGMLADLGTGTKAVALALFTYGSRPEAEAAAAHVAAAWDSPAAATGMDTLLSQMDDPSPGTEPPPRPSLHERTGAEAQTGVAGDGPFVAWVALRTAPQADGPRIRNPAFIALWTGMLHRDLSIFGPP